MADIDEAAIGSSSTPPPDPSIGINQDISDETQDFRFLSSFASLSSNADAQTLPRRGEKDFEPNPTLHQSNVLASARNAMHSALAYPRLHNPKTQIIGVYQPDGSESVGNAWSDTCVCVPSPRGQHFRTLARADHLNRMWLLPEEALYMIERGTLDVRWPDDGQGKVRDWLTDPSRLVPMSLQAAYASFIGRGSLSLDRYTVYAGLKRGGYTVVRADSWDDRPFTHQAPQQEQPNKNGSSYSRHITTLSRLFSSVFYSEPMRNTECGPVIGLGIYRSYNDVYRALSLIPAHDPSSLSRQSQPTTTSPPYQVAYNVYKPSTPFRKSNPGPPDFRIAIINARANPTIPTLEELSSLLASVPYDPPVSAKMERALYMRLRHGYRNVILAIVDQGVVSYLRVSDSGFMKEPLYAQKSMGSLQNKGRRRPPKKRNGR